MTFDDRLVLARLSAKRRLEGAFEDVKRSHDLLFPFVVEKERQLGFTDHYARRELNALVEVMDTINYALDKF